MDEYQDISELKADMKSSQVSNRQLYDSIMDLTKLLGDMFTMFKTASEQMKLEEKAEEDRKKVHDDIMKKLDELLEQNKIIATGMVDVTDLVKEKLGQLGQPAPVMQPQQPNWQPKPPEPMMPRMGPPGMPNMPNMMPPPMGMQRPMQGPMPMNNMRPGMLPPNMPGQGMPNMMPPIGQDFPPPDFPELDDIPFDEPKKKKGFKLFGK